MPITRTTRSSAARRPTIMDKLRNRHRTGRTTTRANRHGGTTTTTTTTTKTTKTTTNPTRRAAAGTTGTTHHHKRHPSMKDKVSGAMLKLKGTVTGKPGQKAAGTRRMHGTDGKGSHHHTY